MTWKGEKHRHQLSARGIKTTKETNVEFKPAQELREYPFNALHLYGNFYAAEEEGWIQFPVTLEGYKAISEGDYAPMVDQEEGDSFISWIREQPEFTESTKRINKAGRQIYTEATWNGKTIEILEEHGGPYGILIAPESKMSASDIKNMALAYHNRNRG